MGFSWIRGKCIGKGAFGTVSVALRKRDDQTQNFAVKSVDLKTGLPGQLEALENEIRILRRMSSPHVVTFLGDDATCEQRNLHMEYMPRGTLADLDADVDEALVRRYTWCLVSALKHVHSNGVVHCDVKGKNVLVGDGGKGFNCKLADFGSAAEFSGEGFPAVVPRGSPLWMAPEVIRREWQGPASDVWSLGCTVIEMLTGKPPWEGNSFDALSRIGFSGEVPEFPRRLSELGRDFLEKCLRREPWRRWSCDQLLQHPFLLPCGEIAESSPRCVLDRVDTEFAEFDQEEEEEEETRIENENFARSRIGKLAMRVRVNWETEGWVVVREFASDAEPAVAVDSSEDVKDGACPGNIGSVRVEKGIHVGTNLEFKGLENERVKIKIWNLGGRGWLVQCNYRESKASWRSQCVWENVDKKKGIIMKKNIYRLYCKLLKSPCLFLEYLNTYLCFGIIYVDYFSWHRDKNILRIFLKNIQELISVCLVMRYDYAFFFYGYIETILIVSDFSRSYHNFNR
ncbi:mitogen-activated protein kinase kinase kinase 18-like [Glycine soja]|uniref:mitogen-activated protein kinase kinase kinase 18-like n=1 Tax=Glycine soja TaxID=3848 RepID=UPI00103F80EF|nr:mitogen-activated protein kinase kinase kinase 18-like [Glycine soja]